MMATAIVHPRDNLSFGFRFKDFGCLEHVIDGVEIIDHDVMLSLFAPSLLCLPFDDLEVYWVQRCE